MSMFDSAVLEHKILQTLKSAILDSVFTAQTIQQMGEILNSLPENPGLFYFCFWELYWLTIYLTI